MSEMVTPKRFACVSHILVPAHNIMLLKPVCFISVHACVRAGARLRTNSALAGRNRGPFLDRQVHKPQTHQVWGEVFAMKRKLQHFIPNLGPVGEALLKRESDGRRWYIVEQRQFLEKVLTNAVA